MCVCVRVRVRVRARASCFILLRAARGCCSVQAIKPSKLKTLSKKQLRQVRKTSVDADGTVVLISPWQKRADHHHIAVRGNRRRNAR